MNNIRSALFKIYFFQLRHSVKNTVRIRVYFLNGYSYLKDMSSQYKVVFVFVICLSYNVATSAREVILVNRNVTDSFYVGKYGCRNNAGVCMSFATCRHSDGLCLCNKASPNFRNPTIVIAGSLKYGNTFGCLSGSYVRRNISEYNYISTNNIIGSPLFKISLFVVIPFSHSTIVKPVPVCLLLISTYLYGKMRKK